MVGWYSLTGFIRTDPTVELAVAVKRAGVYLPATPEGKVKV